MNVISVKFDLFFDFYKLETNEKYLNYSNNNKIDLQFFSLHFIIFVEFSRNKQQQILKYTYRINNGKNHVQVKLTKECNMFIHYFLSNISLL